MRLAFIPVIVGLAFPGCSPSSRRALKQPPINPRPGSTCRIQLNDPLRVAPVVSPPISICSPRPFVDPTPLPARSLKRQRRLAARYRRKGRWLAMSQLAAMLWKLAKDKLARARVPAGQQTPHREALLLRKQAHAHLQESVAMLEQVLREKADFYLARLRLAYYLRDLSPRRAIVHFLALSSHPEAKNQAVSHRVELGRILLTELNQPGRALKTLEPLRTVPGCPLLKAAAAFRHGKFTAAARALMSTAASVPIDPQTTTHILNAWPTIVSFSDQPDQIVRKWVNKGPTWWRNRAAAQITRLVSRLAQMGRTKAAARALRAAGRTPNGLPWPQSKRQCRIHIARRSDYCFKRWAHKHRTLRKKLRLTCGTTASLGDAADAKAARCICAGLQSCGLSDTEGKRCTVTMDAPLALPLPK